MKAIGVWSVFILSLLALQSTLAPLFVIYGAKADLLLLFVVSAALIGGRNFGVGMGFCCGLLQDLAAGGFFGLNLLSKLLIGYGLGMTEGKVFKDNRLLPIIASGGASILSASIVLLLLLLLGQKVRWAENLCNIALPSAFYNMFLALFVHRLTRRIYKFLT